MAGTDQDSSGIEATAHRLGLSAHNVKSIILHVARQSAGLVFGANKDGLSNIATRASRKKGSAAKVSLGISFLLSQSLICSLIFSMVKMQGARRDRQQARVVKTMKTTTAPYVFRVSPFSHLLMFLCELHR